MKTITASELKSRLDAGEELRLLDVRREDEYENFNLGGKLLPLEKIQIMETDDIEDWKEEEIILYCRTGNRSVIASQYLEQMGFTNLVNLQGGVVSWQELEK
ncbi:MAG: rhodanese-like domain-containing protein [Bacteroidetes bacterium]|nr:rhodanese-like domain-containing protein [Bacteroidota bacterium]